MLIFLVAFFFVNNVNICFFKSDMSISERVKKAKKKKILCKNYSVAFLCNFSLFSLSPCIYIVCAMVK